MCGIAGFIGNYAVQKDHIESCLCALDHRGPDASGHTSFVANKKKYNSAAYKTSDTRFR